MNPLTLRIRRADSHLYPVSLDHFRLLRVVGKGAFGKVRIVERKDTGLTFALKYIRKDEGAWHADITLNHPGGLLTSSSRTVGKRSEYDQGTSNARASESSISLQPPLQLSRC